MVYLSSLHCYCIAYCNFILSKIRRVILYLLCLAVDVELLWNSRCTDLMQVAMGRRLGVEEPQLMKIMRATIHTHNEWFKFQMCKDRFEGLLKIDCLKEIDMPLFGDAASKTFADASTPGSSQITISSSSRMPEDGNSPTPVSSRDIICDETAILKVMVSCVCAFFTVIFL